MIQLYVWERKLNEPRMTPIHTDQGRIEGKESALICAICGSEQFEPRKSKALAGFDPTGQSGNHIQSALSIPLTPPSLTP